MTVVRQTVASSEIPALAWKNGGGATRTLAVEPEGAGYDNFLWRVSIADVASSGPFSVFPEVDRTIILLEGAGMILAGGDGSQFALTTPFLPHSFPGEMAIDGKLKAGPCRDFNVMTRRGVANAAVECIRDKAPFPDHVDDALVYCAQGSFQVFPGGGFGTVVPAGCILRMSDLTSEGRVVPERPGSVLISVCITLTGQIPK